MLTLSYIQILLVTIGVFAVGYGIGFDMYGRWYDYGDIRSGRKK